MTNYASRLGKLERAIAGPRTSLEEKLPRTTIGVGTVIAGEVGRCKSPSAKETSLTKPEPGLLGLTWSRNR